MFRPKDIIKIALYECYLIFGKRIYGMDMISVVYALL